jgi:adenylate cyclase
MTGDGLVRDRRTRLADMAFAVILPMAFVGLLSWRRSLPGMAAILGVGAVWLAVNLAAFSQNIWLSFTLPLAAAAPPAILYGLLQIWLGRRSARQFAEESQLLQRFQAPALAKWLVQNPTFLAAPVRQVAAIVFIDLSGFTGLSEKLGPGAVRELLNAFYGLVEEEAAACGGMITNFMGDGAMILFGLPEATGEEAANATRCAERLANRTRAWLASLPPAAAKGTGFKIGAHLGVIVASRLGGATHQQITATGDTVNVASRLMEVAAGHGADIALSDDLWQAAGPDNPLHGSGTLRGPAEAEIRGRTGRLAIWLWHGPN